MLEKLKRLRSELLGYTEFCGKIVNLTNQGEQCQELIDAIRQIIRDADATVVFPQECHLLGVAIP